MPFACTGSGDLMGAWDGELAVYLGIPFAAPPVNQLRFAAPLPHPGWIGVRSAVEPGRASPQPASRLEPVMGRVDFEQDEDCLTLNIWAPPAGDGPYPVLMWIHGGGFITGSGSFPFYRGARLARNGRLVVVTINYRLGALGYLYVPEGAGGVAGAANRGLLDQIAALSWVHENIAAFGGDPEAITLAGQSAGGAAIAAMMADARARRLFKKAIMQSPVVEPPMSRDGAAAICDHLLQVLGIRRSRIADLTAVPINRLLDAQVATTREFARFGAPVGAIQQVADGAVIQEDLIEAACSAASAGMTVLTGTTRDEMDAFLMQDQTKACDWYEALRLLGGAGIPEFTESVFEAYSGKRASQSPAKVASDILTDGHFRIPTLQFVDAWSASGGSAYLYRFDWKPRPDSRYGACHCIDIPFALNNLQDWQTGTVQPAMLEDCDPTEFGMLSDLVQRSWVEFARSGRPGHAGLPFWAEYSASSPGSMQFNVETCLAANPDVPMRELWSAPD